MVSDAESLARIIGTRVRRERAARGWTLDRLAERSGVSRRMVVNVEQGEVNPSVGTLLRLSDALGVGLPALVSPSGASSATPAAAARVVRHPSAVLWTGDLGGRGVLLAGTEPPDVVELWEWTLPSGERHESEAHSAGTRELLQVREGTVTIELDGVPEEVRDGEAISFRSDAPHAYANVHDVPARFVLSVFEPGVGVGVEPGEGTEDAGE